MITKMRPWGFSTNGDERYLVNGLGHGYQLQEHESLHESSSSQQLLDISSLSGDERTFAGSQSDSPPMAKPPVVRERMIRSSPRKLPF